MVGVSFHTEGLDDVVLMLDRFRDRMETMAPVWESMAMDTRVNIFGRTFSQQGLDGAPWAALSPRYAAYKTRRRPGAPIMVFDGDLRDSMTTPRGGIMESWDKGFTVGTDVPYATYHQNGTPNMPARPLIGGMQRADQRRLVKIMQRYIVEGTRG